MTRRRLLILLLGAALFPVGSAYTASNTFAGGSAGQGAGGVSGYAVSNIHFTADAADPTRIAGVSFAIAPAAATSVEVQLSPGTPWFMCTNAGGSVTCATPSEPAVASATALNVVASG